MTVLGPVAPEELGVTLPHEHLLLDLTCLWHPPLHPWQEPLVNAVPTLETRGLLHGDPYVSRPNLRLDGVDTAVEEVRTYGDAGGKTIVDLTVHGISPQPGALQEISKRTGVQVVAGCGYYVRTSHPPYLSSATEEELAETMVREIVEGIADTGVRPGIIGELGTSGTIHDEERKVLRAAARAQRATGLAINVHLAIFSRNGRRVLDILEAAGADLTRVILSHLDEQPDTAYHRSVLERGAYVELDTFGSEMYFDDSGERESSDAERLEALLRLLEEGWRKRLLLSQDVCTKMHLRRYGGFGYAHLLRAIVPRLRRRGVDDDTIRTLLVENPARILTVHQ